MHTYTDDLEFEIRMTYIKELKAKRDWRKSYRCLLWWCTWRGKRTTWLLRSLVRSETTEIRYVNCTYIYISSVHTRKGFGEGDLDLTRQERRIILVWKQFGWIYSPDLDYIYADGIFTYILMTVKEEEDRTRGVDERLREVVLPSSFPLFFASLNFFSPFQRENLLIYEAPKMGENFGCP